jgi:hypothetical protein
LDYHCHPETVDFSEPKTANLGPEEFQVSRQFTYMVIVIRNIRLTIKAFQLLHKKGGDWSLHDEYVAVEEYYHQYPMECPQDLQIEVPNDDSAPWVASPFLGNVNIYHHLSIIMHHRPQIHYLMESVRGNAWKPYLVSCLDAAKKICRIFESMLSTFNVEGLRYMLRGLSFTIYTVLTCTMLHLVSPFSLLPSTRHAKLRHILFRLLSVLKTRKSTVMRETTLSAP